MEKIVHFYKIISFLLKNVILLSFEVVIDTKCAFNRSANKHPSSSNFLLMLLCTSVASEIAIICIGIFVELVEKQLLENPLHYPKH